MKNILLTVVACLSFIFSYSQDQTDSVFVKTLDNIETLVSNTDNNPKISNMPLTGTLMWGDFHGNCTYILSSKTMLKLEFFFDDSTAGKKTFYYDNDQLIKIIDNGVVYYHVKYLRDAAGNPINRATERDLLFFSDQMKKMAAQLL